MVAKIELPISVRVRPVGCMRITHWVAHVWPELAIRMLERTRFEWRNPKTGRWERIA